MSDIHGDSDSLRNEVPRDAEHGAPRPCCQKLSRRPPVHHQDIGLRHEPEPLQRRLLPDRGQGRTADTLDGVGVDLIGGFAFGVHKECGMIYC